LASLVVLLCYATTVLLEVLARRDPSGSTWGGSTGSIGDYLFGAVTLTFPIVGFLILSRQPRNGIGWLFLAIGFVWGVSGPLDAYGRYGLAHPGSLPGPAYVEAFSSSFWAPGIGLMGTFLILLFPDGRLPSRRWRWVARLAALAIVVAMLGVTLSPGSLDVPGFRNLPNPFGHGVVGAIGQVLLFGLPLLPIAI